MSSLNTLLLFMLNIALVVLCDNEYSRLDFPSSPDFVFGAGSSAYQYEGATSEDGRTPSIWDTFAQDGYMHGVIADIAAGGYHKYKEDIQLMVETGLEAYRFSIAWSRLIPNGRGPVNPKGVEYYNNVINELVKNGIEPHVTMVHIDLPQALEDEYGGWLSPNIVADYTAYADVCFREFGDRVLHWITFNEANIFAIGGYYIGEIPPRRCSGCADGNSSTEQYIVAHNILLGHAAVARLYKQKYQNKQHGLIGINLYSFAMSSYTNLTEDMVAAQRARDFYFGWFMNPLVYGDYPEIMKKRVGSRLPIFSQLESEKVKGSFDFLGINYYVPCSIRDYPISSGSEPIGWRFNRDAGVEIVVHEHTTDQPTTDASVYEYPIATSSLVEDLEYIKQDFENPPIYIHENGQRMMRNGSLNDTSRITYLHSYVGSVLEAVRNGVNAKGYFLWSFIDLVELLDGFDTSFGLYYVDLDDKDLKRYPKSSARWYTNFLKGNNISLDESFEMEEKIKNLTYSQ